VKENVAMDQWVTPFISWLYAELHVGNKAGRIDNTIMTETMCCLSVSHICTANNDVTSCGTVVVRSQPVGYILNNSPQYLETKGSLPAFTRDPFSGKIPA